jgi:S-adenosylmethionine:tRNA ribosyltransferase-isomerase
MMVLGVKNGTILHKHFFDIVDLLDENHVLILNNTKVIPARLYGFKDTGAKIEVFLLKETENKKEWEVLIKPSKRVKEGTVVKIAEELSAEVIKPLPDDGKWLVRMIYEGDILQILHKVGNIPLPPYIERKMTGEELKKLDFERYQTVYAKDEGSVAAPTAGLHFTKEILKKLSDKGVQIGYVTLNVGIGTFRPVKCENVLEHKMDSESFEISQETADLINSAKREGKKIVAVGTTTVRTLETAYKQFGEIKACKSASELFIYPPYEFKVIDKLITNFHLPKSTLLMLVSALAGKEFIFKAYEQAIANKYRFYSYGDCMFIN